VVWLNDKFQLIDLLGFTLILATVFILAGAKQRGAEALTEQAEMN